MQANSFQRKPALIAGAFPMAFEPQSPDLFDWTPPPAYPDHAGFKEKGGTSEEAALAIESKAATLRGQVLRLLQSGQHLTADEIAQRLEEGILSIRPRVSELKKLGLIEKTGDRRPNASGMNAAVWRAVP